MFWSTLSGLVNSYKTLLSLNSLQILFYSLAQRVSELLDSFRPGSISYRPFKKHAKETWIIDSNNNNHDVEPQRHPQPTERVIRFE